MTHLSKSVALVAMAMSFGACGGSQTPAETPAPPPEEATEPVPTQDTEPAPTEEGTGAGEGEHTMPDGTTMPGHQHEAE